MTDPVEEISAELHEVYLATARRLGWAIKPEVEVPYADLSEAGKELDRAFARWHLTTLAQIERLKAEHDVGGCKWSYRSLLTVCQQVESELARVRAALEKAHGMMAGAMWKDGQIHVCDDSCFIRAALEGR